MMSPQEGRYTKIAAIAGVISLVIAFLAWIHPFSPRSDASATDMERSVRTSEPPVQPSTEPGSFQPPAPLESSDESHPPDSGEPPMKEVSGPGSKIEEDGGDQPYTAPPDPPKLTRACDTLKTATLSPGSPARIASGRALLSVKTARQGSESYLTLNIASDRDTLSEAVLGAPARYQFKTSLGNYFVNVTEADLAVGAMTVQVGCEVEGNIP